MAPGVWSVSRMCAVAAYQSFGEDEALSDSDRVFGSGAAATVMVVEAEDVLWELLSVTASATVYVPAIQGVNSVRSVPVPETSTGFAPERARPPPWSGPVIVQLSDTLAAGLRSVNVPVTPTFWPAVRLVPLVGEI